MNGYLLRPLSEFHSVCHEAEKISAIQCDMTAKRFITKRFHSVGTKMGTLFCETIENQLQESWGSYVSPTEWMRDTPSFDGGGASPFGYLPSNIIDRRDGQYMPFYRTEWDIASIRGECRAVSKMSSIGVGAVEALERYILGKGFEMTAEPNEDAGVDVSHLRGLLKEVNIVIKEFCEQNKFSEGTLPFDSEIHQRIRDDGEVLIELESRLDACGRPRSDSQIGVKARFNEPDNLTEPADKYGIARWLGYLDREPLSYSFGVLTPLRDTDEALFYHMVYDGVGRAFDIIPASVGHPVNPRKTMVFGKRNVPRNCKRGLSDFMPIVADLSRESKLSRNMAQGAALQAAIAWVEERPANAPPVSGGGGSYSPLTATAPGGCATGIGSGGRTIDVDGFLPGTIPKMLSGYSYKPGPMGAERNNGFIEVAQYLLRRIGVRWNAPEYMISGDACLSEDSEILTDTGWKSCFTIQECDRVGTVNPISGELEFQTPLRTYCSDYSGPMVHVANSRVDLLVTPNHDLYVGTILWKRKEWSKQQASVMVASPSHAWMAMKTSARLASGVTPELFNIPGLGVVDKELFLTFLGFYLGDGSVSGPRRVSIGGISRPRKLKAYAPVLEALGFKLCAGSDGRFHWFLDSAELKTWIADNIGTCCANKHLPTLVNHLCVDGLRVLLNGLLESDGHRPKSRTKSCCYSTVSRQLADDVQIVALKLGHNTAIAQCPPGQLGTLPVYKVHVSEGKDRTMMVQKCVRIVDGYSGKVWCVQVPNGLIVSRRNGRVSISGNSNSNFASTLVAESPFVKAREADQQMLVGIFTETLWKVLNFYQLAGRFKQFVPSFAALKRLVTLKITPPEVATRDPQKLTDLLTAQKQAGWINDKTAMVKLGLDPEVDGPKPEDVPQNGQQLPGQPGEADTPSVGAFAGRNLRDFSNNLKQTNVVLKGFIDGTSETMTLLSLQRLGWSAEVAQKLIDDAKDGKVDDAALAEAWRVDQDEQFRLLEVGNPNHGSDGKFASGGGTHKSAVTSTATKKAKPAVAKPESKPTQSPEDALNAMIDAQIKAHMQKHGLIPKQAVAATPAASQPAAPKPALPLATKSPSLPVPADILEARGRTPKSAEVTGEKLTISRKLDNPKAGIDVKSGVAAVRSYTSDDHYLATNQALRKGGTPKTVPPQPDNAHLQVLAKQPLREPTVTYRGISHNVYDTVYAKAKVGGTVTAKGFMSTSLDPQVATSFSSAATADRYMPVLEIKAKTGLYAGGLSNFDNEHEVIQAHGTKYRLIGIEHGVKIGHRKTTMIRLEEI